MPDADTYTLVRDGIAALVTLYAAGRLVPHAFRAVRVELRAERGSKRVALKLQLEATRELREAAAELAGAARQLSGDLPRVGEVRNEDPTPDLIPEPRAIKTEPEPTLRIRVPSTRPKHPEGWDIDTDPTRGPPEE